jgi:NAD(P)-dependent dehydrogenase (short-subunit alcohol dehydrogenase family)
MKLQGKVALVTGGTTGIGQATARLFQQEGAQVVVTGRNETALAEARKALPGVTALPSDAANLEDIAALARTIKTQAAHVDVLFVNAGIAQFMPIEQVTPDTYDHMFDVNVRGAFFTVQNLLPLMPSGSSIVLTTSVAADLGMATATVYSATKAALSSLTRTLANELVGRGIRVNEVSPGPIETPIFAKMGMSAEQIDGFKGHMAGMVPMKRLGSPDEVARAALYLASADASYVTGAKITVDGGVLLN